MNLSISPTLDLFGSCRGHFNEDENDVLRNVGLIAILTLMTTWCLATLICNLFVISAVQQNEDLHNVAYYFLVNLTIPAIFISVISQPFIAWLMWVNWCTQSESTCYLFSISIDFGFTSFLFSTLAYTTARHHAIFRPFVYQSKMSSKRFLSLITVSWLMSALATAIPTINWTPSCQRSEPPGDLSKLRPDNSHCNCFPSWLIRNEPLTLTRLYVIILPIIVLIFVLDFHTIHIANVKAAAMTSRRRAQSMDSTITSNDDIVIDYEDGRKRTLLLVYLCASFVACWIPFFIMIHVLIFYSEPGNVPSWLVSVLTLLPLMSANIAPFLIAYRNKTVKRLFHKYYMFVLRIFKPDSSIHPVSIET